METKNKEEYISAWHSHINDLKILQLCESEEHRKKVRDHIEALKELVVEIAETKDLSSSKEAGDWYYEDVVNL